MSKIWSPTRPLCRPVVFGPGARTVTRWSTGRLLMPVRAPPLAGLGSGTARLTETILLTPGNLTARPAARRTNFHHPAGLVNLRRPSVRQLGRKELPDAAADAAGRIRRVRQ